MRVGLPQEPSARRRLKTPFYEEHRTWGDATRFRCRLAGVTAKVSLPLSVQRVIRDVALIEEIEKILKPMATLGSR